MFHLPFRIAKLLQRLPADVTWEKSPRIWFQKDGT